MEKTNAQDRFEQYTNRVTSIVEAKFIFRELFGHHDQKFLLDGIWLWLASKKDTTAFEIFKRVPELIKRYSVYDFLDGKVLEPDITDTKAMHTVGVGICLLFLVGECWALFGERLHAHPKGPWPSFDDGGAIKKEVLDSVPLVLIQKELGSSLLESVGEPYYNLFIEKLELVDGALNIKNLAAFEKAPAVQEHMLLMLWTGLMRIFLDAVYFYFGPSIQPPASATQGPV